MLIGPGGAGKGTVAAALTAQDPTLWLSRSWTTRKPRPGERERNAYVFVDRPTFEKAVAQGGFFEWAEFLDYLMGTPIPDPPPGTDVLLEIDVQGAEQVLAQRPDATVILLLPPSLEVQASGWRHVVTMPSTSPAGWSSGAGGGARAPKLPDHTVVNDDLGQALGELTAIVASDPNGCSQRREPGGNLMAQGRNTLMDPPIEDLLDKVDSKFTLVALGSARARQVNSYYNSLGEGLGKVVPAQVASVSGKPVSIAFEEIAAGKATYTRPDPEEGRRWRPPWPTRRRQASSPTARPPVTRPGPSTCIEVLDVGGDDPAAS